MRRATMIAGGAVLGGAAVMALPTPGKPQQVAIAANAGATRKATPKRTTTTTAAATTTTHRKKKTTAAPKPTTTTVVGALEATQYGQLQVKLTVKNGKIANVGFTTFVANDGRSQQIDSAAAPILIRETIAARSAHIASVSGATYTSGAYEQSLQAAIDKAGLKA